jgi:hypothetical protein
MSLPHPLQDAFDRVDGGTEHIAEFKGIGLARRLCVVVIQRAGDASLSARSVFSGSLL